ncbi:molybdate ABC transporter permease subunit [Carboxydothermus pertinax]|uniref:Molybdenum transport system permease n=1 Tax=Carboxydothermus pertinax TaxID=870242 RepID=A0A1L8CVQ7_9THEO|nr:molybdate ABC transporter permease subunit [Carboxydothermus pertinax]GAV22977.1 molybdate transport system permease protein [Carboxydothermus pertinax]
MKGINFFPLYLSFKVSFLATFLALLIGLPLAWLLAKKNWRGKELLDAAFTLPMVLPPTVLGYYLLLVVGRQSAVGHFLETRLGISLVFTWEGAVLAATIISLPLIIKSARAAFERVDPNLEDVARSLGKGEITIFFTISLPLAWRGIVAGTILAWARALGDFGATLMVAGNIPGKTQTMSIAIYDAVVAGNFSLANTLVAIITVIALLTLWSLNRLNRKIYQFPLVK